MQKQISGISLRPPKVKELEGVELPEKTPLLGSFVALIVGKPKSGKTHLLREMLTNPDLYYQKFNFVFILSPSIISEIELELGENYYNVFSLDWIYERINLLHQQFFDEDKLVWLGDGPLNILFIIDDMIQSVKGQQADVRLNNFIYNRRHFFTDKDGKDHGTISIVFTTQKYSKFPSDIRSNIDAIYFFKLATNDYKKIKEEHVMVKNTLLDQIIETEFMSNSHSFIYINLNKSTIHLNFDRIMF